MAETISISPTMLSPAFKGKVMAAAIPGANKANPIPTFIVSVFNMLIIVMNPGALVEETYAAATVEHCFTPRYSPPMDEKTPPSPEDSPADPARRDFLKHSGSGLLAVHIGGVLQWLTPRQARAGQSPLRILSASERTCLEALGDTLLPGAAEAGLAHFVDHHLSVPAPDCLLLVRYLDVPPPFAAFYRDGLAALDAVAMGSHGNGFEKISPDQRTALVEVMSREDPAGWAGPPAPFFYYVLRSDAVDVVYGTEAGFKLLNIPYLAHIPPPTPW